VDDPGNVLLRQVGKGGKRRDSERTIPISLVGLGGEGTALRTELLTGVKNEDKGKETFYFWEMGH